MIRTIGRIAAVLTAAAILIGGHAPAANAEPTTQAVVVDGSGYIKDDWGDHYGELGGSLCSTCPNSQDTDLVVLWQSVLAADGYLSVGQIDGYFGARTKAATALWQQARHLSADGMVGYNTWNAADENLEFDGGYNAVYQGAGGEIRFALPGSDTAWSYQFNYVHDAGTGCRYDKEVGYIYLFSDTVTLDYCVQ